ncbi:hypothetical protein [Trujillonella endophytica]|uniref:Uncharacterized protein n=1 Tax=Trujillonella endophytica TaxID=673521 RepID=A0A1H8TGI1_9ACTN|nr:hypothetical protein [Trujillella endophytica]SEO90210.1 hypothetical protein SAMN05660991_02251 [Trujillella endophytica]
MSSSASAAGPGPSGESARKHSAGAFDVRNIIAALIGFYGVVLTVYGVVDSDNGEAATGGVNANLWTGLAMLVFAGAFALWSWLRPIVVDPAEVHAQASGEGTDDGSGAAPH